MTGFDDGALQLRATPPRDPVGAHLRAGRDLSAVRAASASSDARNNLEDPVDAAQAELAKLAEAGSLHSDLVCFLLLALSFCSSVVPAAVRCVR
jgi:hypothetical protein